MGRYLQIAISTDGLYTVGSRSWGNVGIVGRGIGAGFTANEAYTIRSPADAETLFGITSSLYKSILLLFENGATKVIAVAAEVTADSQELFNGDGSTKVFTVTEIPVQPLDTVAVDAGAKTEGIDFTVDYGNKQIIFVVAPPAGTDNVAIDYSRHSVAHIQAGLAALTTEDVQIMVLAQTYETTLLSELKTHCVATESTSPRRGYYMLPNGSTTLTLATTLASYLSTLIAHKSLKDAAAGCAGKVASLAPWKDLTMKTVSGLQQSGRFTQSEIDAFDEVFIVTMFDPPKLTGTAVVFSTGWTIDDTAAFQFIDQIRVAFHLTGVLDYGLTNPNIIGELKMNRSGLQQLDTYMRSLLTPWVNAGEIDNYVIDNPALRLFELTEPEASEVAAMAALQAARRVEGAYQVGVQLIYSGTIIFLKMNVSLTGGV